VASGVSNKTAYIYLAYCEQANTLMRLAPVVHNEKKLSIEAPSYTFEYQAKNHILFKNIVVNDGSNSIDVAKDANLKIRANLKKFFTFEFDSRDIRSRIEASRTGPQGFIGFASFYLKVLFFNINLKLTTGVSFWEDSVHVPMVMNIPVKPHEWLHPASGLLYSWRYDPGTI